MPWTSTDRDEFRSYVQGLTDEQLRQCYAKEVSARRLRYARLCKAEADRRGIEME